MQATDRLVERIKEDKEMREGKVMERGQGASALGNGRYLWADGITEEVSHSNISETETATAHSFSMYVPKRIICRTKW